MKQNVIRDCQKISDWEIGLCIACSKQTISGGFFLIEKLLSNRIIERKVVGLVLSRKSYRRSSSLLWCFVSFFVCFSTVKDIPNMIKSSYATGLSIFSKQTR